MLIAFYSLSAVKDMPDSNWKYLTRACSSQMDIFYVEFSTKNDLRNTVFYDTASCSLVIHYRCFKGTSCLNLPENPLFFDHPEDGIQQGSRTEYTMSK
jgi:hypothetical protein